MYVEHYFFSSFFLQTIFRILNSFEAFCRDLFGYAIWRLPKSETWQVEGDEMKEVKLRRKFQKILSLSPWGVARAPSKYPYLLINVRVSGNHGATGNSRYPRDLGGPVDYSELGEYPRNRRTSPKLQLLGTLGTVLCILVPI